MSCLSFFPRRPGCLRRRRRGPVRRRPDGGQGRRAARARQPPKYIHQVVGGNFRLDALQAAILRVKLPQLAGWSKGRQANAERYRVVRGHTRIPAELRLPRDVPGHIYNQFVIRAPRGRPARAPFKQGVGTEVYYPLALHLQPCFAGLGLRTGAFPHAEAATREALALPIFAELTENNRHTS